MDIIFQYMDRLDTKQINVDMFFDYLIPRLNQIKQNVIKSMYYTIQRKIGSIGEFFI